jgi:hypothetical protein
MMPKQKKGGGVWLTFIIIVVLLAAYGAYAYYSGMWPFSSSLMPVYTASPTVSVSSSPVIAEYTYDIADTVTISIPKTWNQTNEEAGTETVLPVPSGNFGSHIAANDAKTPNTWVIFDVYSSANYHLQAGETWQAAIEDGLSLSTYPIRTQTVLGPYAATKYSSTKSVGTYIIAYPATGGALIFWSGGPDQSSLDKIQASIKVFTK